MELTKKDKKHIEEQVHKLDMRMKMEATEYARECERYYYQCLRDRIDVQLQVLDEYPDMVKGYYNK